MNPKRINRAAANNRTVRKYGYDGVVNAVGNAIGNSIVDAAQPKSSAASMAGGSKGSGTATSSNDVLEEVVVTARKIDMNPGVDFTPGMTGGDEQRARSAMATELQRQLNVTPEQADQMASVMQQKIAGDGLDSLYMMGAGSDDSSFDWTPKTAAQQAAYDSVVNQGKSHVEASDVARLVATKEQIESLIDGLPQMRETVPDLARQVEEFIPVFNNAMLSKDVYYDASIQELLPRGFSRISDGDLSTTVGLLASDLRNTDSGYFAAVYKDSNSGSYILANRGTEAGFTSGSEGLKDWATNYLQGSGERAPQYDQAIATGLKFAKNAPGPISFTGHSLGGGLAMAQALVTNRHATVFNAAGVHENTLKPYNTDFSHASGLINAYNISGEALNFVQDGGKYPLALAPGLTLNQRKNLVQLPQVQGTRHSLAAMTAPTTSGNQWKWGQEVSLGQRYATGGAIGATSAMVNLHYMNNVIYSLGSGIHSGLWGK